MEAAKSAGDQPVEPRDTYKVAYIIHFLLGAGNLLPWNAFITAVDYFGYLYPVKHVEKVFSVAYMTSSLLVLVLVICWGGWGSKLSYRLRMNLGFSMFALSLLVTPIIDWARNYSGSNGAYGVTVASVVTCGLADGLVGGSLIGSAGKLPKQYMQAVFAGTASSGTTSLSSFISLFISDSITARKVQWQCHNTQNIIKSARTVNHAINRLLTVNHTINRLLPLSAKNQKIDWFF